MLDHRRTGYVSGGFSTFTDNLRIESDRLWRSFVDELADYVPLIVLDARTDNPIVVLEVKIILSKPERLHRTLFVVGPQGEAAALLANDRMSDSPGIHSAREEEITTVLKRYRTSRVID
jgi:hypothetical protein